MSYKVTSALVVAKDQVGKLHHCYHGAVIQWLSDEQAAHFLRHGLVVRTDAASAPADPGAPEGDPEDPGADADGPDAGQPGAKPRKTAPPEQWVEYGAAQGHDRAELEALSRQELIDLLG